MHSISIKMAAIIISIFLNKHRRKHAHNCPCLVTPPQTSLPPHPDPSLSRPSSPPPTHYYPPSLNNILTKSPSWKYPSSNLESARNSEPNPIATTSPPPTHTKPNPLETSRWEFSVGLVETNKTKPHHRHLTPISFTNAQQVPPSP